MGMFEQMETWRVIALCVGGLAVLVGTVMILSHGFRVLLWSLLVMVGVAAGFLAVGDQAPVDAAQLLSPLQDALESGQPWAEDFLREACQRLDASEPPAD